MLKLREPFSQKVQLHIKQDLLQRLWDQYVPEAASAYGQIKLIYLKNGQEEPGRQPRQVQLLLHLLIRNKRMQLNLTQHPQAAGAVSAQLARSLQRVERYYSTQLRSADRAMYQAVRQYFSLMQQAQEGSRRYRDWQRQYRAIEQQKDEYRTLLFFTERLRERFMNVSVQTMRAAEETFVQNLAETEYQTLAEELVWQEKPWMTAYLKECDKAQCKEIARKLEKDPVMKRVLSSIQKQSAKKKLIAAAYKLGQKEFCQFYWQVTALPNVPQESVIWKQSRAGMLDGLRVMRPEALQKMWEQIHAARPGKESDTIREQYRQIERDSLQEQIAAVLEENHLGQSAQIVELALHIKQLLQNMDGASGADRVLSYLAREQEIHLEQIRQQQEQAVEVYQRAYGGGRQISGGQNQERHTGKLTENEIENLYEWSQAFLEDCLVVQEQGREDNAGQDGEKQDGLEYEKAPELRHVLKQINDYIERNQEPAERLTLRWQEQLSGDDRIQGLLAHIQTLEEKQRDRLVQALADFVWRSVQLSSQNRGNAQEYIKERMFEELSGLNRTYGLEERPLRAEDTAFARELLAVEDREFAHRLLWTQDREFAVELLAADDRTFAKKLLQVADQKFAKALLRAKDQKFAEKLLQLEDQGFAEKLLAVEDREFAEKLLRLEDQEFARRLLQIENRKFAEKLLVIEDQEFAEKLLKVEDQELAEKLMQSSNNELPDVPYGRLWEWGTTLLYQPDVQREWEDADLLSAPRQEAFSSDGSAQQEDMQTQMIRRQIEMAKDRNRLQGLIRQINHQAAMELVYTDAKLGQPQVQELLRYIQRLDERQYGVLVKLLAQIAVVQKQYYEKTQAETAGAETVPTGKNPAQTGQSEAAGAEAVPTGKNLRQTGQSGAAGAETITLYTEQQVQVYDHESVQSVGELLRQQDNIFIEKLLAVGDREFAEQLLRLESRTFAEQLLRMEDQEFAEKLLQVKNEQFAENILQLLPTRNKAFIERLLVIEDQEFAKKLLRVENPAFAERLLAMEDRDFAEKLLHVENQAFAEKLAGSEDREFIEKLLRLASGELVEKLMKTEDKAFTEKLLQLFQTDNKVLAKELLRVESQTFAERLLAMEDRHFARKLLQLEDDKFAEELLQAENREPMRKLPDMSYRSLWAWGEALLNPTGRQDALAVSSAQQDESPGNGSHDSEQQSEQAQRDKDQLRRLLMQISRQTQLRLEYKDARLGQPQIQALLHYIQRLDETQYHVLIRELAQITRILKVSYEEPAAAGAHAPAHITAHEIEERRLEQRTASYQILAESIRNYERQRQLAFRRNVREIEQKIFPQMYSRGNRQRMANGTKNSRARAYNPQSMEAVRDVRSLPIYENTEQTYDTLLYEGTKPMYSQPGQMDSPPLYEGTKPTYSQQMYEGAIPTNGQQAYLPSIYGASEQAYLPSMNGEPGQAYSQSMYGTSGRAYDLPIYGELDQAYDLSRHGEPVQTYLPSMNGEPERVYDLLRREREEQLYGIPMYEEPMQTYSPSRHGDVERAFDPLSREQEEQLYGIPMYEDSERAYSPQMYQESEPAYNLSPDQPAVRNDARAAVYRESPRQNRYQPQELAYSVQNPPTSEDAQQERALRMQQETAQMKSVQQQLDQKLKEMEGQLKRVEDSAKAKEDVRTFAEQVKRQLYEELHVEKLRRGLI